MTASAAPVDDGAVRAGLIAGVGAYFLWGLFPAYFQLLSAASAFEILAHRIVWAVPFGALALSIRSQWGEVRRALAAPKVLRQLLISAIFIAANWSVYVWAVLNERVLEASLGYYINPLMYVAAGVFIMGEKLRTAQIIAVALAALGVAILTIGSGVFPLVSIILAVSFTIYGFVRKTTPVGAMPGLFIETVILAPIAFAWLAWLVAAGRSAFLSDGLTTNIALISAGPVTILPLVLFAMAARRLRLTTLGFLQYIGPTLQLIIALLLGETFTPYHAVCFGLIWTALAIYSLDSVRARNAEKKLAKAALAASAEGA